MALGRLNHSGSLLCYSLLAREQKVRAGNSEVRSCKGQRVKEEGRLLCLNLLVELGEVGGGR